jgi:hypothetical protein
MKTFLLRCLPALFLALPLLVFCQGTSFAPRAPMSEEMLAGQTVYFFLDTECKQCSLGENFPTANYWVVTGIRTADFAAHSDLLSQFSATLTGRFPQAKALLEGLVFRFHFTPEETEAFRQLQLERKRAEGFQVVELDLQP